MIEKIKGVFVLYCDACNEMVGEFETFGDARIYVKENKWVTKKLYNAWMNYCPDCNEKHFKKKDKRK